MAPMRLQPCPFHGSTEPQGWSHSHWAPRQPRSGKLSEGPGLLKLTGSKIRPCRSAHLLFENGKRVGMRQTCFLEGLSCLLEARREARTEGVDRRDIILLPPFVDQRYLDAEVRQDRAQLPIHGISALDQEPVFEAGNGPQ